MFILVFIVTDCPYDQSILGADSQYSFHPSINSKSARLRPRSSYEMSRGDLLRKETNNRMNRLKFEQGIELHIILSLDILSSYHNRTSIWLDFSTWNISQSINNKQSIHKSWFIRVSSMVFISLSIKHSVYWWLYRCHESTTNPLVLSCLQGIMRNKGNSTINVFKSWKKDKRKS